MKRFDDGRKGRQGGFTWLEVAVALIFVAILAAIAIPDFLKFCGKAQASEAKTNLGAIYTLQVSYFQENHTYAGGPDCFSLLNWNPEGRTKYTYWCGDDHIAATKGPIGMFRCGKVRPVSTKRGFTVCAVGNIDGDTAMDTWSIDQSKTLINVVNDLAN